MCVYVYSYIFEKPFSKVHLQCIFSQMQVILLKPKKYCTVADKKVTISVLFCFVCMEKKRFKNY